jgi:hypothetical protein
LEIASKLLRGIFEVLSLVKSLDIRRSAKEPKSKNAEADLPVACEIGAA